MKYFTLEEFTNSDTAKQKGIDNTLPAAARKNIVALVANCLDPLRETYGSPIKVSSGYRCPALNKAVGGSATSQHVKGEAADLIVSSGREGLKDLLGIILRDLVFDQVIFENNQWIHISFKRTGINRGTAMVYSRLTRKYSLMSETERTKYIKRVFKFKTL